MQNVPFPPSLINPGSWPGLFFLRQSTSFRKLDFLMLRVVVMLAALRPFILHVAGFTAFGILRIAPFSKILLSLYSKNKLLTTFAANKNPVLEMIFHRVPPLMTITVRVMSANVLLPVDDRIFWGPDKVNKNVPVSP